MPLNGVSIMDAYHVLSSQSTIRKINTPVSAAVEKGEKALSSALSGLACVNTPAVKIRTGTLTELTLEEFLSKNGIFKKGSAYMDGKPYSGLIDIVKDENRVLMEYLDGSLKKSTRFRQNKQKVMVPVLKKVYSKKDVAKLVESYSLGDKTPQGTHRIGEVEIKPNEIKVMKFGKDLNVTTSRKGANGKWKTEHEIFARDKKRSGRVTKTKTSGSKVYTKDYSIRIT